jgi:FAD/FMN-containing dehydrogenase
MASLPHITVCGAVSTATHGSGVKNGCLSTAVSAIEIVKADGEILTLKRDRDDDFSGIHKIKKMAFSAKNRKNGILGKKWQFWPKNRKMPFCLKTN